MNIVLYAPAHNCAESKYLDNLTFRLAKQGFSSYTSALEPLLLISRDNNILDNEILSYLSLAYDIYLLYEKADCCVGILNGRVPDEATMVKIGIAYSLGVKVLLYKKDCRVLFPTGDNSMILGLSDNKVSTKENQLINKLHKLQANRGAKKEFSLLSPSIKQFINLGKDVYDVYNQLDKSNDISNSLINNFKGNPIINLFVNAKGAEEKSKVSDKKRKVYCSGGLFSPCEQEEMQSIALSLEACNYNSFLPQRDGAEPFVLNSINNPFANLPLIKYLTKYINKIIFSVDIAEIIRCEDFVVNLNGRAYDEGAMVELGVAFALGKPITLFFNDKRYYSTDGIHPLIKALSLYCVAMDDYSKLDKAIEKAARVNYYMNNGYKLELSDKQLTIKNMGDKYIKFLYKLKKPKNNLLT